MLEGNNNIGSNPAGAATGLRRRRGVVDMAPDLNNENDATAAHEILEAVHPPQRPLNNPLPRQHSASRVASTASSFTARRMSSWYGWLSAVAACLAIVTTNQPEPFWQLVRECVPAGIVEPATSIILSGAKSTPSTLTWNTEAWGGFFSFLTPPSSTSTTEFWSNGMEQRQEISSPIVEENNRKVPKYLETRGGGIPVWLRWIPGIYSPAPSPSLSEGTAFTKNRKDSSSMAAAIRGKLDSFETTILQAAFAVAATVEVIVWTTLSLISKWPAVLKSLVDPAILHPSASTTATDLIDKILTSTPRLLCIANIFLAVTYIFHQAVAEWFLGSNGSSRRDMASREQRLGGFLVFKLLLISAVVGPDTLDLLILLSWYTCLSLLRSLGVLCANVTTHTSQSGQPPRPGVWHLLTGVLVADFLAAAVCVGLFHGAGWGMVALLTCDCALLAMDIICHLLSHLSQVLEQQHGRVVQRWQEQRGLGEEPVSTGRVWRFPESAEGINEHDSVDADTAPDQGPSAGMEHRLEQYEKQHSRRVAILDSTIFALQLGGHVLTVAHFLHIWKVHGFQFTLIDGVLALHLNSAITSLSKKIASRRNLHRIARDLNTTFVDASEWDLRKAAASGDVCCICLGALTSDVKKISCGHLYHTQCLREVVARARSMQTARCPLCRASVVDGRYANDTSTAIPRNERGAEVNEATLDQASGRPPDTVGVAPTAGPNAIGTLPNGGNALFRFSTEGIFPAWLPLPGFSFEVVRRTAATSNANTTVDLVPSQIPEPSFIRRFLILAGAIPLSPEEEAVAMEQLVDMFPQYDRADLLRELRARGSSEGVAEIILLGSFTGIPRGGGGDGF